MEGGARECTDGAVGRRCRRGGVVSAACAAVFTAAVVPVVADAAPYQAGRVVVRYRAGTSEIEQAAVRRRADTPRQRAIGVPRAELVATAPGRAVRETVAGLERDPRVLYAEPNYRFTASAVPNDPRFAEQWALQAIRAPEAWDVTTGSADVTVAVVDTGTSKTHPDLSPNLIHDGNAVGDTNG